MAKPAHTRVTVSGVFGTASDFSETWSWGVNLTTDPGEASLGETAFDALATAVQASYNDTIKLAMPDDVVMTECKWANVGADGTVLTRADGSYRQGVWQGVSTGANLGTPVYPLQTALAVSLITARAGATGRGRFFLPFPAATLNTPGVITGTDALTYANIAAEFVNDLNAIGGGTVSVVSSKGYTSPVTGVRVGRVPDTMRSRRSSLPEAYMLATTTISQ